MFNQQSELTTIMEVSSKSFAFFITLFVIYISFAEGQRISNSTGICELEVPVASLLPPELKHTASKVRGNGTNPTMSKIKICCTGYRAGPHSPFHCLPDCPNGCGLGNCTAPDVCTCYKAAVIGPNGQCIPTCPKSCLNGECFNHFCNCNPSFALDPTGKFCVLGCTKNCGPGGKCVGRNQCQCNAGYHLNNQGTCSLYCDEGYQQMGDVCEPLCPRGCQNGVCSAPGRCTCNPGWTLDPAGNSCIPKCSSPCLNGICSAPNVCTCKQGYIKDPTDFKGIRCIAHCPQGCPNGICSAPNFCICQMGYRKQGRGSNVCVKH